jgi:hypothetical protein
MFTQKDAQYPYLGDVSQYRENFLLGPIDDLSNRSQMHNETGSSPQAEIRQFPHLGSKQAVPSPRQ